MINLQNDNFKRIFDKITRHKKEPDRNKKYLWSDSIVIGMSSDDSFADNKIYQHIGTENLESDARKAETNIL
jgi:hypothetical protein